MHELILTEEDLRRLEKRFGPTVRRMGPWNSDGIFGYCSVPTAAVERAAMSLNHPALLNSLHQLNVQQRNARFLQMLHQFGAALIEKIVAAHQERFQIRSAITEAQSTSKVA